MVFPLKLDTNRLQRIAPYQPPFCRQEKPKDFGLIRRLKIGGAERGGFRLILVSNFSDYCQAAELQTMGGPGYLLPGSARSSGTTGSESFA
jgi:hypothetical protein